jgi:hypothetical protein
MSPVSYHLSSSTKPHCGKTTPVQKGLILSRQGGEADLCEEGVGFGVPILQYGRDFVFPGSAEVSGEGEVSSEENWKAFDLNLIERHERDGRTKMSTFSWVVQRMYNRIYKSTGGFLLPHLGKRLSSKGVYVGHLDTPVFFRVNTHGKVLTKYLIVNKDLHITLEISDIKRKGLQRIYVSNELGGSVFTEYRDGLGRIYRESEIGGWRRIQGNNAVLSAPGYGLSFSIDIPNGTQAFVGREMLQPGIRWSGVIFALPPATESFDFVVRIHDST